MHEHGAGDTAHWWFTKYGSHWNSITTATVTCHLIVIPFSWVSSIVEQFCGISRRTLVLKIRWRVRQRCDWFLYSKLYSSLQITSITVGYDYTINQLKRQAVTFRCILGVQWNPALRPPRLEDHLVITAIFFQTKRNNHWVILLFWRPR